MPLLKTLLLTIIGVVIPSGFVAAQSLGPVESEAAYGSAVSVRLVTEDVQPALFYSGPTQRTAAVLNDATLNDVCAVGDLCWAVGERGTLLRSVDSGRTWSTQVLSVECRLHSVCFLTNQIGFVAGSTFNEFDRRGVALLLTTRDGGETWRSPGGDDFSLRRSVGKIVGKRSLNDLPPLNYVRFFDLENGVAIGLADSATSSGGAFRTGDGGKTWNLLKSDVPDARWTTGAFLSAKDGLVVGYGIALGAVVNAQVVGLTRPDRSLRQLRDASISHQGTGWAVGDAGLVQHSRDGGITWQPAANVLPPHLADVVDFRTVCQRGENICIAGRPGSVILHSHDSGATWQAAIRSETTPIHRTTFVDDSTVVAVGPFGIIQRSQDAGKTWSTVRNAGYRAGVLCLTSNPQDVSLRMMSSVGANDGLRIVVAQSSVRLPRTEVDDRISGFRLAGVLPQIGANVFDSDWMFARTQPLQQRNAEELMKVWRLQTDGQLEQRLPERMAELLRIWRPDVVSIERATLDDQVSAIWLQAWQAATEVAAATDSRGGVLQSVGLMPWNVKRVVVRQPGAGSSSLQFAGDQLLANAGTSADLLARQGLQQLTDMAAEPQEKSSTETSADLYEVHNVSTDEAPVSHLFAGIMPAPGTASRRQLQHGSREHRQLMEDVLRKASTARGALSHQAQSNTPLNLIAHLGTIGEGLPDQIAMQQLLSLSRMYEAVENLDGQISVLKEVATRFPDSPEAADAVELLFQFYSSEELRFLRRNDQSAHASSAAYSASDADFALPSATDIRQIAGTLPGIVKPPVQRAGRGTGLANSQGSAADAVTEQWDRQADLALQHLARLSPARAAGAHMLLRKAANSLRQTNYNGHSSVLSEVSSGDDLFSVLARAEMQAVHGAASSSLPVVKIAASQQKPYLDATLADSMWQQAQEITLTNDDEPGISPTSGCLVMLAWDADHIYLSGRVERVPDRTYAMDKSADRVHDVKHGIRDRIEFSFDVDRDYTTAFHFVIDEAGQTSERCWRSRGWNPEWFVAAETDETSWRFEIAIPQKELVAQSVKPSDLWAIRIQRTVPGVLQQSLKPTDPDAPSADTNGHGLLRFIRTRK